LLSTYQYFQSKYDNDLKPVLMAFKAARYFSPSKVCELKPSSADIDSLCKFTFLNSSSVIDGLKTELPQYLASAEGVSHEIDVIQWWKIREPELPCWSRAFKFVLFVQPSSAASERVFSILTNSFSTQQESSLEDYVQLSVMLQYNYRC